VLAQILGAVAFLWTRWKILEVNLEILDLQVDLLAWMCDRRDSMSNF